MISRRAFITTLVGSLAAALVVEAPQASKVWRVGVLTTDPTAPWDVFCKELDPRGYRKGRNV